jgi:EmrB/QacA subfamily drug resistance transporter
MRSLRTGSAGRAHEANAERPTRHPGVILAVLCSAQVMLAVDLTVVNVANASIERALGFTSANLQWTITAYALTYGGFLLLGGRMSDVFGRRRLFIAGVVGFALASLGAGSSATATELIAARAAQGLCAAVVSPAVLSLLAATFPEGRLRHRAYAIWATSGPLGATTGFLIGGIITTVLGWRWIFFLNVPIAALAVSAGAVLLARGDPRAVRTRRLDVPGAVVVTTALALVIYGLGEAQSTSWTSKSTLIALFAAPVFLAGFVLVEHRARDPLLPFALLRRRAAVGNIGAVLQQSIGTSIGFLAPLFMQHIWGFRAVQAGAGTLPLPIGFAIGIRLSSRFVNRFGVRRLAVGGFLLAALGYGWIARTPVHGDYFTTFLPGLVVCSTGQGLVFMRLLVIITSGVRKEDQGIAAGLYTMSQQLGGAVGLAAVATVASAAAVVAGSRVAAEAHGIRVAFFVCMCIAIFGAILVRCFLVGPATSDPAQVAGEVLLLDAAILDGEPLGTVTPTVQR